MPSKTFTKNCDWCKKQFSRRTPEDKPPRFCSVKCSNSEKSKSTNFRKHNLTRDQLERLKRFYAKPMRDRKPGELKRLAGELGMDRTNLYYIARRNGFLRKNRHKQSEYFWDERELAVVERATDSTAQTVQRHLERIGFKRSITSIDCKMRQLRVRKNREHYSANDLALCLGVDVHFVTSAINLGKLKAKRFGEDPDNSRGRYQIKGPEIYKYIKNYLPEINFSLVDKYWIIDLIDRKGVAWK